MAYLTRNYKNLWVLSILGAKEWFQLRFFQIVIFISLLLIIFGYLLSNLTFAVQERLLFDFGLASLELCLVVLAATIGSHTLNREIERRTLYILLVRPIEKWNLVLSAVGSIKILSLSFIVFFVLCLLFTSRKWGFFDKTFLLAFIIYLKSLLIASFAILASLLVRPLLALTLSFSFWLLGYSMPDLVYFVKKINSTFLDQAVRLLDYFTPQFYRMNWKSYEYVVSLPSLPSLLWSVFYLVGWILLLCGLASLIFQRKEIG